MTGFSQNHDHVSNKPLGFVRHVALDGSRGPPPSAAVPPCGGETQRVANT